MSDTASGTVRTPFDLKAIKAVVFDAYGTLFQLADAEFRVIIAGSIERQGLKPDDIEAVYKTWYGVYSKVGPWRHLFPPNTPPGAVERIDRNPMTEGPIPEFFTQWEWWRRQWVATFEFHKLDGDSAAAADDLRHALSHLQAYPDALSTTDRLAAAGLRIALLSNADEDFLQSAVSKNRLRFSVMQSSESLRAYKPHRATFLAAVHRLDCAPEEVLYVGDSAYADVHGALNAGLRSVWVRRTERPYPVDAPPADLEVHNLAEIADALLG
ncbi:MAG: HAD family hydrolase [Dehalococcoidia bacterium]|nr:HAD family hydrolase [Dehalococcoidia bacterium]